MKRLYKPEMFLIPGILIVLLAGCRMGVKKEMRIEKQLFGKMEDGTPVDIYTLANTNGVEVKIINYGGKVVSLKVPDKNGKFGDIVQGYDTLEDYIKGDFTFGATIGRYGNRIAKGKFTLDGKEYQLSVNNGENHLHGGPTGFHSRVWKAEEVKAEDNVGVKLTYFSKDDEEGFPGNLNTEVVYILTKNNELKIDYTAKTDKKTIINLTNHSYFNLAGEGSRDILEHIVMINADNFTPVDKGLITLGKGEIRSVKDTPMDFTKPTAIGARINNDNEQLKFGNGYDLNWVLNKEKRGEMTLAARVYEPTSGRVMEIYTTEPGLQFYTGNFLSGQAGKGGKHYNFRYAFCMETQHYPDSPNKPNFPSVVFGPGETYRTATIHKFSTK